MSIEWLLYLIDFSEKISPFFITSGFVLAVVSLLYLMVHHESNIEYPYKFPFIINISYFIAGLCIIFGSISFIFIPSPKTMYAIALAHYSKQSDIPAKVLKAIEVKLDEVIEGVNK